MMREYLNGTPETAREFDKIFDSCDRSRGLFLYRNENGRKESVHQKEAFDSLRHLRGEQIQGRSPVRDNKCKWGAIDIDKKIPESDFCSKLWIYDRSLFPFKSLGA